MSQAAVLHRILQEKDIANPIATILICSNDVKIFSFDLDKEADAIENAVEKVLKEGYRTIDIMSEGKTQVGTEKNGRPDRRIYRIGMSIRLQEGKKHEK